MSADPAALLARWCAIPSHAGDPGGQRRMADELARAFGRVGTVAPEPVGPGGLCALRVRSPQRAGRRVLLVGHYDTVPHDGPGAEPAVAIEGDLIRARGAADMKGGLAVMLTALGLVESARRASPSWEALIVPDEELGTPWSRAVLGAAATGAAAALVFEPALPDGRIVRSRGGVGTVTIAATGRSAHAGRDPETGRSAIAALAELVGPIESLAGGRAGTAVAVTTISGGSAPNAIAAEARATVDLRVTQPGEPERLMAGIAGLCAEAGARRSVAITVAGGVHRPPRPADAAGEALYARYADAARATGVEIGWVDVGGGSDANLIPAEVPVLDGLGVVGGGLHAPDEYAELPSIPRRAALAAALMGRIGPGADRPAG